jgi:tRNA(adenine34) deaminase
MRLALDEARNAERNDEVPVGCIVLDAAGRITGRGGDLRQSSADPWGHAEIRAIRKAAAVQGDWRLDGHTLVVTLEPCPMCAGLILMARIGRVIYGATNDKWGAAGTRLELLRSGAFPHQPEVMGGILRESCASLLSNYFSKRRDRPTSTAPEN